MRVEFLMKVLYDPTGTVSFLIGMVISVVLFVVGAIQKSKKSFFIWGAIILVLSLLVGYGMWYSKNTYTYMPDINFGEEYLENTYRKLDTANLFYPHKPQYLDNRAQEYWENNGGFSNFRFLVTGSTPAPKEFVKQGSTVSLSVTLAEPVRAISIDADKAADFDPFEFYGGPESAVAYDYNTTQLRGLTLPVGLKRTVDGINESGNPGLHVYPPMTEKSIVRARLIDYFTNETVDEAACYLGDEIFFPVVQRGTYYILCSCDGYENVVSNSLIRLHYDESEEEYSPYWRFGFEKENSYSSPFKIRLQDKHGNALSGIPVEMRVVRDDDPSPKAWDFPEYITDENGYLTNHEGWYLLNGGILEFQICEGYTAQIFLDNSEDKPYPVPYPDGPEVCMIIE